MWDLVSDNKVWPKGSGLGKEGKHLKSGWNLRCGINLSVKVQGDGWEKDPWGLGDVGARAEGVHERAQGKDLLVSDTETWTGARPAWGHR